MTIPSNTVRVAFVGTAPGGEIFNWGFWLNNTTINSEADANTLASSIRDAWITNAGADCRGLILNDTAYTQVRVYAYPSGGPTALYVGAATISVGTGTSTLDSLPLQCAMVVSLHTGFAGRTARGRLYLPATGQTLTAHQYGSSQVTAIANDFAAFFNAVNTLTGVGSVAVVSQKGTGNTRAVTSVVVDSRVDVQRRRANSEASTSTQTSTVTP